MTDFEICMGTGDVPTPLVEVNQQSHTNLYSQKENCKRIYTRFKWSLV